MNAVLNTMSPFQVDVPPTPPYFRQIGRIPGLLRTDDPDHPELVPQRRVREEFKYGFGDGTYQGWNGSGPVIPTYPATRQWIDDKAGRGLLQNVYMVGHVQGQCSRAPRDIVPEPFHDEALHQDIAQVGTIYLWCESRSWLVPLGSSKSRSGPIP